MKDHEKFFLVRQPPDLQFLENEIQNKGAEVSPRGKLTKEIRNILIEVQPGADFINRPNEQAEGVAINTTYYVQDQKFAKMRVTHILNKVEFEINETIALLKRQPTTRRARILEPDYHPWNIACVQLVQFFRRAGALETTVFIRSSNVHDVLPLDIYAIQQIAEKIRTATNDKGEDLFNLAEGPITIHIGSAHVYQ